MTALPPELLQAFAETHYIVHHEPPFTMHIGQACPVLQALMAEHFALSATFITAWNPFSQRLPNKGVAVENGQNRTLSPGKRQQRPELPCTDLGPVLSA